MSHPEHILTDHLNNLQTLLKYIYDVIKFLLWNEEKFKIIYFLANVNKSFVVYRCGVIYNLYELTFKYEKQ